MTCSHCNENVPPDYDSPWCPFCGKDLDISASAKRELPPIKFKWRLFLCALLSPPFLTLLSASMMHFFISPDTMNEDVTPWVGLICGSIGGVICGITLGLQSRNLPTRIALSIFMSAIMIPVCVTLCIFGCTFGGYRMEL